MKCFGAICEAGVDVCCHECDKFAECTDDCKCDEHKFYEECLSQFKEV